MKCLVTINSVRLRDYLVPEYWCPGTSAKWCLFIPWLPNMWLCTYLLHFTLCLVPFSNVSEAGSQNRDRKCVDTETRCLQRARVQGRPTTPCSNSNLNWEIENKNGLFTLVPIEYHIMLKHPARAPSVNAALISFKFAIFSAMLQFLHVKISR